MRNTIITAILSLFLSHALLAQTTVILVRHAEKATGDNPGLTVEGEVRANELARMLQNTDVDMLFSTPYKRTQETLKPLAGSKKLEVQEYEPYNPDQFQSLLKTHEGQTLVFSGHSNTIPMFLNLLTQSEAYDTFPEWQYDDLFIVTVVGDEVSVVPLKFGNLSEPQ